MLDWPFRKRGAQHRTPSPRPPDLPQIADFEKNDAVLKVWLPTLLVDRLNWLSVETDLSRPDVIRALIFRHLYGEVGHQAVLGVPRLNRHDVVTEALNRRRGQRVPAIFPQPDEGIKFSAQRVNTEDLDIRLSRTREFRIDESHIGASEDNFRFDLPKRMKEDVVKLAQLESLTPSECVRKLLVLALLGAAAHANWQRALGRISPDAYRLEAED